MQISKNWRFPLIFRVTFLINSLASGVRLRTPKNADFQIFLNYYPNFREKFDKNLKNFGKNCKFSIKIIKNRNFFIDFFNF